MPTQDVAPLDVIQRPYKAIAAKWPVPTRRKSWVTPLRMGPSQVQLETSLPQPPEYNPELRQKQLPGPPTSPSLVPEPNYEEIHSPVTATKKYLSLQFAATYCKNSKSPNAIIEKRISSLFETF